MPDMGYILGTVGYAEGFIGGKRIVNAKTLLNNSISFTVSPQEVRAGENNALIGTLFFDPNFAMTLEDATFKLEYLALKTGSKITQGSTDWKNEQVTVTENGKITVKGTPIDFGGFGKVGFYRVVGSDEEIQIEFNDKVAEIPDLKIGDTVCVKYNSNAENAREIKISSNFIPSELYLLVHTPMFLAGQKTTSESQKVGELVIEVPRFLIDPSGDLSLASNGVATVPLNGTAQVSYESSTDCDNKGFYGRIKEVIWEGNYIDGINNIVIADSSIDLSTNETQKLEVVGFSGGMTMPKKIEESRLTFTSSDPTKASVSNVGIVTAIAAGETTIEVVVTEKPTLVAKAVVTVS